MKGFAMRTLGRTGSDLGSLGAGDLPGVGKAAEGSAGDGGAVGSSEGQR